MGSALSNDVGSGAFQSRAAVVWLKNCPGLSISE